MSVPSPSRPAAAGPAPAAAGEPAGRRSFLLGQAQRLRGGLLEMAAVTLDRLSSAWQVPAAEGGADPGQEAESRLDAGVAAPDASAATASRPTRPALLWPDPAVARAIHGLDGWDGRVLAPEECGIWLSLADEADAMLLPAGCGEELALSPAWRRELALGSGGACLVAGSAELARELAGPDGLAAFIGTVTVSLPEWDYLRTELAEWFHTPPYVLVGAMEQGDWTTLADLWREGAPDAAATSVLAPRRFTGWLLAHGGHLAADIPTTAAADWLLLVRQGVDPARAESWSRVARSVAADDSGIRLQDGRQQDGRDDQRD